MAPSQKRKTSPAIESDEASAKRRFVESEVEQPQAEDTEEEHAHSETRADDETATSAVPSDRMARFKALRARQAAGMKQNAKEVKRENDRVKVDPNTLTALNRKNAIAQHKLLKDDTEEAGGDFERKRAWDWTIEESEKWDRRMEKKDRHRKDVAFSDYTAEARKTYTRQMQGFKPDLEAYEKEKMEAIQKAAATGGLEIVETENGELIAVDKDGSFLSTTDTSADFSNKPSKEALDRLVNDIKKAEEVRLEQRKKRNKAAQEESGDVTYINMKNKQFNEKLNRFYDKYTTDIRENFERGTAI